MKKVTFRVSRLLERLGEQIIVGEFENVDDAINFAMLSKMNDRFEYKVERVEVDGIYCTKDVEE